MSFLWWQHCSKSKCAFEHISYQVRESVIDNNKKLLKNSRYICPNISSKRSRVGERWRQSMRQSELDRRWVRSSAELRAQQRARRAQSAESSCCAQCKCSSSSRRNLIIGAGFHTLTGPTDTDWTHWPATTSDPPTYPVSTLLAWMSRGVMES